MKIKVGYKWKSIEGLSKGKEFTVVAVDSQIVTYKSKETNVQFTAPRKHFEKYIERVNTYWNERNKSYKQ